jgi:nucleotide sugar dehydrogenase
MVSKMSLTQTEELASHFIKDFNKITENARGINLGMEVCVLGLGHVGLPTAKYAEETGLKVWGYDTSSKAVANARNQGINATSVFAEIPQVDAYLICVSTTLQGRDPDLSAIFEVSEKISATANASSLISVESTVVPGTCRKLCEMVFHERVCLVHVPHRYWVERPKEHGVHQMRVIGAVNKDSLNSGLEFYKKTLDIPLHEVWPIEVAEMCKISENAYRYVQIAFAEELRMMCEEIELNFMRVREACNTKWNIEIPEARDGIEGVCLPKDIRYLASVTSSNILLRNAINLNQKYVKWLSKKAKQTG